jgi:hypothetical protein
MGLLRTARRCSDSVLNLKLGERKRGGNLLILRSPHDRREQFRKQLVVERRREE